MNITRALILLAISVAPGCATIHVPRTPEAQACNRECMMIANQCVASGVNGFACYAQERNCWRTCPGAWESKASPAQSYAEAE